MKNEDEPEDDEKSYLCLYDKKDSEDEPENQFYDLAFEDLDDE